MKKEPPTLESCSFKILFQTSSLKISYFPSSFVCSLLLSWSFLSSFLFFSFPFSCFSSFFSSLLFSSLVFSSFLSFFFSSSFSCFFDFFFLLLDFSFFSDFSLFSFCFLSDFLSFCLSDLSSVFCFFKSFSFAAPFGSNFRFLGFAGESAEVLD